MSEHKIATLECAGCTAPLSEAIVETGVYRCPFCGYVNILPKQEQSSEVTHYLYNGDAELKAYDFERAYNAYSRAAELDGEESKAYFGMALAANRIKYIKDIVNNRWQAICCEVSSKKFANDKNYLRALEYATEEQKEEYISRAEEIDYIRKSFAELEESGLDYDTFICVKVSDGEGKFTQDSVWAGKLYDNIAKSGAKPFYSEREIGDRVGVDYEALILYALYKSESMIIVCSNEEYLRTPWVQNEYTRYYAMMNEQEKLKNSIMIAFTNQAVERIPGIPGKMQGVDLHSFDASQKINEFVDKFAHAKERADKEAEAKAKREAERKAREEANERERLEQQKAIEEQQRILLALQKKLEAKEQDDDDGSVKYCTSCGAENSVKRKFCSKCGEGNFTTINEKYCMSCATVNSIPTKFCKGCGGSSFTFSQDARRNIMSSIQSESERKKVEAQRKREQEAKRKADEELRRSEQARKIKEEEAARQEAEAKRQSAQDQLLEYYNQDKKRKNRATLFTLLAIAAVLLIIIISYVANTGYANYEYDLDAGGYVATGIPNNDAKRLKIKTKYKGEPVVGIAAEAFLNCDNIKKVKIPKTVKTIGYAAFANCDSLKKVKLSKGIENIGDYAFSGCYEIKRIRLPKTVEVIGDSAFENCGALKRITTSKNLISIGSKAFAGCESLKKIKIRENVTYIGSSAFLNCYNLTIRCKSYDQPYGWDWNWNPSDCPVVWGGSLFAGLFGTDDDWDSTYSSDSEPYEGVTADGFYWTSSYGEVTITGYEYTGSFSDGVIEIPSMIGGLPVKTIGENAFSYNNDMYYCAVIIPDSVTSIEESAFYDCDIIAIAIPDSVTYVGQDAFAYCYYLEIFCEADSEPYGWNYLWNPYGCEVAWGIDLDELLGNIEESESSSESESETESSSDTDYIPEYDENAEGFLWLEVDEEVVITGWSNLSGEVLEIPSTIYGMPVTTIGEGAFSGLGNCCRVYLPDSITTIEDEAFYDSCIETILIPSSVTYVGDNAFGNCYYLEAIYCGAESEPYNWSSSWNPNDNMTLWNMLFGFSNGFLYMPYDGGVEITGYDGAATDIVIPSMINGKSVISISDYAFANNEAIESVVISEGIKSIDEFAFYGCISLEYVELPSTLVNIGECAFNYCESLLKIVIPRSVEYVGSMAFYGSSSITIYCQVSSEPYSWAWDWNMDGSSDFYVVWGYAGE